MTETLMVREDRQVSISAEQMDLIKKTIAPDATPAELQLFIYDNTRRGVNPLDKMIHFTKRGGKYTPVTGIDFMRTRAAETGEYAGSDDALFAGEVATASFLARVTVHRFVQGERCPFTATARWSEYYPGDKQGYMWQKMPHTMLAKCAEALALRKGFPQQISGLYTTEEMAQANDQPPHAPMIEAQVVKATPLHEQKPRGPGDDALFDDEPPPDFDDGPTDPRATRITQLSSRKGEKNGKPWTQWFITLSDGAEGSFFDGQLAVAAQAAYAAKVPVIATWEQKGKYRNLVGLLRAD